jgi:hypothetical protein
MKLYPELSPEFSAWLLRQPVFFTGSAPTHGAHVNVSPKGMPSSHFAVLSPRQCAYIDRTGSGCETIAHAYENGRLTLMFMSFGPVPRIMRLFCRATIVEWDDPAFEKSVTRITGSDKREGLDGARAVIVCDIFSVQTSCGYAVPRVKKQTYAAVGDLEKGQPLLPISPKDEDANSVFEDRTTLSDYLKKRADNNTVRSYQAETNATSMDGLPGLRSARRDTGEWMVVTSVKHGFKRAMAEKGGILFGFLLAVLLYFIIPLTQPVISLILP